MSKTSCFKFGHFIKIYIINKTLHGPLGIRILCSRAESISHSFVSLTRERCMRYFQHSKIKLVSPRGYVISSIFQKYYGKYSKTTATENDVKSIIYRFCSNYQKRERNSLNPRRDRSVNSFHNFNEMCGRQELRTKIIISLRDVILIEHQILMNTQQRNLWYKLGE